MKFSFKIIQEYRHSFQSRFFLSFYLNLELDFRLGRSAQVLKALQSGTQTDALSRQYRLSELHLVHSVVDHHLQVVYLDDLVPHIGQHRQGEVSVRNGALERTFHGSFLCIHVNPLMVQRSIGKQVDAMALPSISGNIALS